MFEKITNKFVPDQKESSKTYRNQIGIFQGWVSTAVNALLFIFKLFVGIITGAVSLIADAVHTLSDYQYFFFLKKLFLYHFLYYS